MFGGDMKPEITEENFSLNRKRRNNMSYKAIENEAWKTNYPFAIAKVHFYIKLSCRVIKSL